MKGARRLLSLVLPEAEASAIMEELLDAAEPERVRAEAALHAGIPREDYERRERALHARAIAGGLVVTGGGGAGYLVGACPCLNWIAYHESEIPGVVAGYLEHTGQTCAGGST